MDFKFFIMTASKFKKWKITCHRVFIFFTECLVGKFHGESRVQWKSNQKVNMMHVQDCCFAADTVGWNLVAVVVA